MPQALECRSTERVARLRLAWGPLLKSTLLDLFPSEVAANNISRALLASHLLARLGEALRFLAIVVEKLPVRPHLLPGFFFLAAGPLDRSSSISESLKAGIVISRIIYQG